MVAEFHFAQPAWLVGLLLPVLLGLWRRYGRGRQAAASPRRLQRYAAQSLLPLLLRPNPHAQAVAPGSWRLWLIWPLLVVALAGPRWDRVTTPLWQSHTNLVILLDISASMELRDTRPSRLVRAKAEIDTLLAQAQGIRAGLVAFASVALMIAPLSEDTRHLREQLAPLDSQLVFWQGSRLEPALLRAERMFVGQQGTSSQHIWLLSDGDFAEPELLARVEAMAAKGIHLHVFGVGTVRGEPGTTRQGMKFWSQLDESGLQALATAGGGIYRQASSDGGTALALRTALARTATARLRAGTEQVWHERFYLLLAPLMLLLLPSWRRVWYGGTDHA